MVSVLRLMWCFNTQRHLKRWEIYEVNASYICGQSSHPKIKLFEKQHIIRKNRGNFISFPKQLYPFNHPMIAYSNVANNICKIQL